MVLRLNLNHMSAAAPIHQILILLNRGLLGHALQLADDLVVLDLGVLEGLGEHADRRVQGEPVPLLSGLRSDW